jgi:hypothetical protein
MNIKHLALTLLPLLAVEAVAQGPQTLVGLTRFSPAIRQQSINCQVLSNCFVTAMPPAANAFAGGIAWDPVRSGTWITNGRKLAKVDDDCNVQCGVFPMPSITNATTFITGLETVDMFDQLWSIDNTGRIRMFTNTCPPQLVDSCQSMLTPTPSPNHRVTTAIGIDEGIGLVFLAYSNLSTGTSKIAINDLSDPCVQFEIIDAPQCLSTFGPITGLACDWGAQMLYASNGVTTARMNYAWSGSNLVVLSTDCCPGIAVLDPTVGITIHPSQATSVGSSCNNGSCPNCPMIHSLRNDPVVGNMDFHLSVDGAFGNSFSFCMIGDSPCNPAGIAIPPLCGPVLVGGYVGYLGPNLITGGTSVCGNSSHFSLPLPPIPALVGDVYSSQVLNLCVGAGGSLGFAMSNCLSWELQGI